jgi:hypothetical protein
MRNFTHTCNMHCRGEFCSSDSLAQNYRNAYNAFPTMRFVNLSKPIRSDEGVAPYDVNLRQIVGDGVLDVPLRFAHRHGCGSMWASTPTSVAHHKFCDKLRADMESAPTHFARLGAHVARLSNAIKKCRYEAAFLKFILFCKTFPSKNAQTALAASGIMKGMTHQPRLVIKSAFVMSINHAVPST